MIRIGIAKAKNSLSGLINRVAYGGQRVILGSRGQPKVALISLEELRRLEAWEGQESSAPPPRQRRVALDLADAVRVRILERRGGALPASTQDLERLRRKRLKELAE